MMAEPTLKDILMIFALCPVIGLVLGVIDAFIEDRRKKRQHLA